MAFLRGRPGQMGVFKCFRLDMRGRILLCTIVMYMFIASKVCMYVCTNTSHSHPRNRLAPRSHAPFSSFFFCESRKKFFGAYVKKKGIKRKIQALSDPNPAFNEARCALTS